jgi:hypothetical protein
VKNSDKKAFLSALFSGLWAADALLTLKFVGEQGLQAEANPLMRLLLEAQGMYGFLLVKALVLAFWLAVGKKASTEIHVCLCAIMALVVTMALHMVVI